jgi:hypothetical protein
VFTYDDDPAHDADGYQSILTAAEIVGTSGAPLVPTQRKQFEVIDLAA